MKKILIRIIIDFISILDRIRLKLSLQERETQAYPFRSLSPINKADDDQHYCKILSWALENRVEEDIKNIALAGPIGSGKSSVLRTFQKRNKDRTLHFLNISLASFKDSQNGEYQKKDIPRLIELSILQQLFYHEKDNKIPDSRFKKIKSFSRSNLIYKSLAALVFIFSSCFIFFNTFLTKEIIKTTIPENWNDIIHSISLVITILGIGLIFYNSIRFLYNIRINKLKFNDAEIEVNDSINKSILNHHLDEILYFFEVTKYNAVVIEDLDRFEQTEIFSKLREINLLLNNSNKIEREIVFIYAIKDDMFVDNDRTKFFDFILPIIPVINFSNSNEILLEKKKNWQLKISDNLIDNISLFIDDMRLLNNIINEYYIHHLKLDNKLDQNKLLSIIVYKNLFPHDYSKLLKNDGVLHNIINGKLLFIQKQNERINNEIKECKDEIDRISSLKIKDSKELRSLYVMHYIGKLKGLKSFQINNQAYEYSQLIEEDYFDSLISNEVTYSNYQNTRPQSIPHAFEEIEKEVDPSMTYLERLQIIDDWSKNKTKSLRKDIENFETERAELKSKPLKELLSEQEIEIDTENPFQNQLISVLLRNGFINEDYLDYLSIFYEGSITKDDRKFLLDVRSQISNDFDYKLTKKDKLISKISLVEFEREYILNLCLVDYLLSKNTFKQQKVKLFTLLSSESDKVIQFINEYIDSEFETGRFIRELCKYWENVWKFVIEDSSFSVEKQNKYLKLIVQHASSKDIIAIAENSNLKQFIEDKEDILSILPFDAKFKEIIELLNIKFQSLNQEDITDDIHQFLLNGEHYQVNVRMIELILRGFGNFSKADFECKNYSTIINSSNDNFINQIDSNINLYIGKVLLELGKNVNEEETPYIRLLNNGDLEQENIYAVIQKVETIITNLSDISELSTCEVLISNQKALPTWSNVLFFYEKNENEFVDSIIEYINDITIAETLSDTKIPQDVKEDDRRYRDFISKLLHIESINDTAYALIIISVPYVYPSFSFNDLSYEKAELLITMRILTLSESNFASLKEVYGDLQIRLIEHRKAEFFNEISKYDLDQDDFELLLESGAFTIKEKTTIIDFADDSVLAMSTGSLTSIGELIISDPTIEITDYLLEELLTNSEFSNRSRIQVFCLKENQLSENLITNFLETMPKPYSNISIKGKRPLIQENNVTQRFVEVLKQQNYISKFKEEKNGIRISTFLK